MSRMGNKRKPSLRSVSARLLVMGHKQVGKSAAIVRFTTGRFIENYCHSTSDWLYRYPLGYDEKENIHNSLEILEQKDVNCLTTGDCLNLNSTSLASTNNNNNNNNNRMLLLAERVALDKLNDGLQMERTQLNAKLQWANAYVIMYSVDNEQSFSKAIQYLDYMKSAKVCQQSTNPSKTTTTTTTSTTTTTNNGHLNSTKSPPKKFSLPLDSTYTNRINNNKSNRNNSQTSLNSSSSISNEQTNSNSSLNNTSPIEWPHIGQQQRQQQSSQTMKPILLLGNKCDLDKLGARRVSQDEARSSAMRYQCLFGEISIRSHNSRQLEQMLANLLALINYQELHSSELIETSHVAAEYGRQQASVTKATTTTTTTTTTNNVINNAQQQQQKQTLTLWSPSYINNKNNNNINNAINNNNHNVINKLKQQTAATVVVASTSTGTNNRSSSSGSSNINNNGNGIPILANIVRSVLPQMLQYQPMLAQSSPAAAAAAAAGQPSKTSSNRLLTTVASATTANNNNHFYYHNHHASATPMVRSTSVAVSMPVTESAKLTTTTTTTTTSGLCLSSMQTKRAPTTTTTTTTMTKQVPAKLIHAGSIDIEPAPIVTKCELAIAGSVQSLLVTADTPTQSNSNQKQQQQQDAGPRRLNNLKASFRKASMAIVTGRALASAGMGRRKSSSAGLKGAATSSNLVAGAAAAAAASGSTISIASLEMDSVELASQKAQQQQQQQQQQNQNKKFAGGPTNWLRSHMRLGGTTASLASGGSGGGSVPSIVGAPQAFAVHETSPKLSSPAPPLPLDAGGNLVVVEPGQCQAPLRQFQQHTGSHQRRHQHQATMLMAATSTDSADDETTASLAQPTKQRFYKRPLFRYKNRRETIQIEPTTTIVAQRQAAESDASGATTTTTTTSTQTSMHQSGGGARIQVAKLPLAVVSSSSSDQQQQQQQHRGAAATLAHCLPLETSSRHQNFHQPMGQQQQQQQQQQQIQSTFEEIALGGINTESIASKGINNVENLENECKVLSRRQTLPTGTGPSGSTDSNESDLLADTQALPIRAETTTPAATTTTSDLQQRQQPFDDKHCYNAQRCSSGRSSSSFSTSDTYYTSSLFIVCPANDGATTSQLTSLAAGAAVNSNDPTLEYSSQQPSPPVVSASSGRRPISPTRSSSSAGSMSLCSSSDSTSSAVVRNYYNQQHYKLQKPNSTATTTCSNMPDEYSKHSRGSISTTTGESYDGDTTASEDEQARQLNGSPLVIMATSSSSMPQQSYHQKQPVLPVLEQCAIIQQVVMNHQQQQQQQPTGKQMFAEIENFISKPMIARPVSRRYQLVKSVQSAVSNLTRSSQNSSAQAAKRSFCNALFKYSALSEQPEKQQQQQQQISNSYKNTADGCQSQAPIYESVVKVAGKPVRSIRLASSQQATILTRKTLVQNLK